MEIAQLIKNKGVDFMLKIEKICKELNKREWDQRYAFNFKVRDNSFKILDIEKDWITILYNEQILQINRKCKNIVEKPVRTPEGICWISFTDKSKIKEILEKVGD